MSEKFDVSIEKVENVRNSIKDFFIEKSEQINNDPNNISINEISNYVKNKIFNAQTIDPTNDQEIDVIMKIIAIQDIFNKELEEKREKNIGREIFNSLVNNLVDDIIEKNPEVKTDLKRKINENIDEYFEEFVQGLYNEKFYKTVQNFELNKENETEYLKGEILNSIIEPVRTQIGKQKIDIYEQNEIDFLEKSQKNTELITSKDTNNIINDTKIETENYSNNIDNIKNELNKDLLLQYGQNDYYLQSFDDIDEITKLKTLPENVVSKNIFLDEVSNIPNIDELRTEYSFLKNKFDTEDNIEEKINIVEKIQKIEEKIRLLNPNLSIGNTNNLSLNIEDIYENELFGNSISTLRNDEILYKYTERGSSNGFLPLLGDVYLRNIPNFVSILSKKSDNNNLLGASISSGNQSFQSVLNKTPVLGSLLSGAWGSMFNFIADSLGDFAMLNSYIYYILEENFPVLFNTVYDKYRATNYTLLTTNIAITKQIYNNILPYDIVHSNSPFLGVRGNDIVTDLQTSDGFSQWKINYVDNFKSQNSIQNPSVINQLNIIGGEDTEESIVYIKKSLTGDNYFNLFSQQRIEHQLNIESDTFNNIHKKSEIKEDENPKSINIYSLRDEINEFLSEFTPLVEWNYLLDFDFQSNPNFKNYLIGNFTSHGFNSFLPIYLNNQGKDGQNELTLDNVNNWFGNVGMKEKFKRIFNYHIKNIITPQYTASVNPSKGYGLDVMSQILEGLNDTGGTLQLKFHSHNTMFLYNMFYSWLSLQNGFLPADIYGQSRYQMSYPNIYKVDMVLRVYLRNSAHIDHVPTNTDSDYIYYEIRYPKCFVQSLERDDINHDLNNIPEFTVNLTHLMPEYRMFKNDKKYRNGF